MRRKEKENVKTNLSPLVSPLADQLSQKAFAMTLTQFNEALNYEAQDQEGGQIWLISRKGPKEGQDVLGRTVRQLESGWSCSCNMPVYLGIHCRHILCVMIKLQMVVPWQFVNSRWWRDTLQPEIHLKNKSPFQSKQELASRADNGAADAEEREAEEVMVGAEVVEFVE